ncbi:DUF3383 family protein [Priestia megaterium]|uniref:DUF3383 family protein n=1 Tax=Priestia megaterium TaxID=1404 RepID=UPI002E1D355A|nr:DUF3383 family protein [Priestia megaterium]
MPLQDVSVKIDLVKPVGLVGLGKPLILAEKAGDSSIKTYSEIDAVKADFPVTTEAYKKAAAIFAQENRPANLAIATYDPAGVPANTAVDAVSKYYDQDWFFLVTADAELSDQLAVADYIESKKFKMYATRTVDTESRNAFKTKDYDYVIDFYHPTEGEHAEAALIGEAGSQMVGSITWKFKTLKGITPIDVPADELALIHNDGAIAYVTKAGIPQTSEGIVASGEYIDVMHGKSWIKTNIETSIQKAFADNGKVSFDARGIALLDGSVTTVLQQGFKQGIIAIDGDNNPLYTVTTKAREEMPAAERAQRIYNGLSFSFELAGAIHEANIKGQIAA